MSRLTCETTGSAAPLSHRAGDRSMAAALPVSVVEAIGVLRAITSRPGMPLEPDETHALDVIYRAYAPMLLSVARRFVGADDADDVVHDVFCRLPWTVASYRGAGFGGWLKQCVVRTALMRLRASRRRKDVAMDDPAEYAGTADAGGRAVGPSAEEAREMADEIRWALARLSDPLRRVVVLRMFEDYTHQQVGDALGITPIASEVRLCRAIKHLRTLFPEACRATADGGRWQRAS